MEPHGSFVRSSYFHVAALRLSDRLEIHSQTYIRVPTARCNEICFPDIPILPKNNLSPYECAACDVDNEKNTL